MSQYIPTIGIECHVQLNTKTKLFAAVENDAKDASPNTLISHICLGMPGALPVLNEESVRLASKAAFALNTKPQKFSKFDRKHYFYPDLPKGYQISQYDQPIVLGGHVNVLVNGKSKKISITRAHLEEDAGKSTHPAGQDYSLVDLNRAGTPLLEIVSEPDIHSAEEARAYAKELYLLMKYAGVSEANLYYGNMRFDVNISISKTNSLGTRAEIKNLNSFKSVEKAVEYEIKRQSKILDSGDEVVQETRGWDDSSQTTFSQRTKEDAHDYRYFPDPDIPPVVLDDKYIESVSKDMPILPDDIRDELKKAGIDETVVETIIEEPVIGKFIYSISQKSSPEITKRVANWLSVELQSFVAGSDKSWDSLKLSDKDFINLAEMTNQSKVSSTAAKAILLEMVENGSSPEEIASDKNLLQISDTGEIEKIVQSVIANNPKAADDIRSGESKVIGFLVGQVMKESRGKANPGLAKDLIIKNLK
jgi:aspartyl-tRNA(Asn)/glutamyl-tRNA(Gln) amidotransferase subunit B